VLVLVAEGLRNKQIAKRLFISERTVKAHVSNVFSKLRVKDRIQAVRHAVRLGLVRM
jgi:DNA-binding NarL/FixJ family response regulator